MEQQFTDAESQAFFNDLVQGNTDNVLESLREPSDLPTASVNTAVGPMDRDCGFVSLPPYKNDNEYIEDSQLDTFMAQDDLPGYLQDDLPDCPVDVPGGFSHQLAEYLQEYDYRAVRPEGSLHTVFNHHDASSLDCDESLAAIDEEVSRLSEFWKMQDGRMVWSHRKEEDWDTIPKITQEEIEKMQLDLEQAERNNWIKEMMDWIGKDDEVQGRSRKHRKDLGRDFSRFPPDSRPWEFGRKLDFSRTQDVTLYLTHLDHWMRTLRKPKTASRCHEIAVDFIGAAPYRRAALVILAKNGNPMAGLLLHMVRGTLPCDYEDFELKEVQTGGQTNWSYVGVGAFVALAGAAGYAAWRHSAAPSFTTALNLPAHISDISGFVKRITACLDSVTGVWDTVKDWIKRLYKAIKGIVIKAAEYVYPFIKPAFLLALATQAVELVKTYAPKMVGSIVQLVMSAYELPARMRSWWSDKPQSGNFTEELVSAVYEYTVGDAAIPMRILGGVTRAANTAKSLEYFYSKFGQIISAAIEYLTGELQGLSALENEIIRIKDEIEILSQDVTNASTEILLSKELSNRMSMVSDRTEDLQRAIVRAKGVRPFVAGMLTSAALKLHSLINTYHQRMVSGEERVTPVVIYLWGKPGIGKSYLFKQICTDIWATAKAQEGNFIFQDEKFSSHHVYPFLQSETYHDAYQQQPIILIDDFFQSTSPDTRRLVSTQIIGMCSSTPYPFLVADMYRKNHVFCTSRLIFITSNLDGSKLKGENTGVASIDALTGRFTISVEMQETAYGHRFVLGGGQTTNSGRKVLEYDELVSLAVACLVERQKESMVEVKARVYPKWTDGFRSQRITVAPNGDKGKDKEKEKEYEWKEADERPGPSKVPDHTLPWYGQQLKRPLPPVPTGHPEDRFMNMVESGGDWPWYTRVGFSLRKREFYAFNSLPERVREWVRKRYPRLFWPPPEHDQTYEEFVTTKEYDFFQARYPVAISMADWEDYMRKESSFRCYTPYLLGGIALLGVAAVGAYSIVRSFMPDTAYDKKKAQSFSYDSYAKGHKGKPGKRARDKAKEQPKRVPPHARQGWLQQAHGAKVYAGLSEGGTSVPRTLLADNFVWLEVRSGPKGSAFDPSSPVVGCSWGLYLRDQWLLFPHHTVFSKTMPEDEIFVTAPRGESYTFRISEVEVIRVRGDCSVCQVPRVRRHRNIIKHFATTLPTFGEVDQIMPNESSTGMNTTHIRAWEPQETVLEVNWDYGELTTDVTFHGVPNQQGDCGAVYVHAATSQIFAFHLGGSPTYLRGYATFLTQDDFSFIPARIEIVDPKYLRESNISECGVYPGVTAIGLVEQKYAAWSPTENKIVRSTFDLDGLPSPPSDREPAMLKKTVVDGEEVNPLANVFANKLGPQKCDGKFGSLENLSGFLSPTFNAAAVGNISIGEAIFGNIALGGTLQPLDKDASLGYELKKMRYRDRRAIFGPTPDDPRDVSQVDPVFLRMVQDILDSYKRGEVPTPVFEGFLKMELRSPDRARTGATRLIDPIGLQHLVAQRCVLGTFLDEVMKDPVHSPVTLAINPHSSQWTQLHARHCAILRYLGFGDFRNYDYSVKNPVVDDFVRMVASVHPEPLMAECAILSNFIAYHLVGRLLFLRPWGTSSGSLITAVFNCFANFWIHKKAWLNLYSEESFPELYLNFVGDDSLFSCPSKYSEYTMEYLAEYFKNFDMAYTPADKGSVFTSSWENCTFLKRRFVPRGGVGTMAPLAGESMTDMIKWTEAHGDREVMASTVRSYLLEAWHYGPEFYEKALSWAKRETARHGLETPLPDWVAMRGARLPDYANFY